MSKPAAKRTTTSKTARAPARRRSQAERREATRERILDAAEEMFGVRGYYGVTLRDVAMQAGVDTALLHYHFGGKEELFSSVLGRRGDHVNKARMNSLEAYEREHGERMTPHGVIWAYLKPALELIAHGGPQMRNYGRVVAKVNSSGATEDFDASVLPFDPVVHKLVAMLKKVRPECSEEDLYWFYHMMSGAISLSYAETGRIDTLSKGRCKSADLDTIFDRMASIFAAGLAGLEGSGARGRTGVRKARRTPRK